jgi:hypothetical protein
MIVIVLPMSDDTGETGTGYSSAAALVEVAAYRIDLDQDWLDVVLDNLWKKECIKEEWQLQHLDSLNYGMLLQVPRIGNIDTMCMLLIRKAVCRREW